MTDDPQLNTLFGLQPTTFGIASIAAALVALGSQWLVVVFGVALAGLVMFLVVILGIVSGLLALVSGVCYQHVLAIITGIFGLVLIGFVLSSFVSALTTF